MRTRRSPADLPSGRARARESWPNRPQRRATRCCKTFLQVDRHTITSGTDGTQRIGISRTAYLFFNHELEKCRQSKGEGAPEAFDRIECSGGIKSRQQNRGLSKANGGQEAAQANRMHHRCHDEGDIVWIEQVFHYQASNLTQSTMSVNGALRLRGASGGVEKDRGLIYSHRRQRGCASLY